MVVQPQHYSQEETLMARVEASYPTPIQGVSTLAPRNRGLGQAGEQLNMRSDPVAKLTRRPSLSWQTELLDTTLDTTHHSYYRDGKDIRIIVDSLGVVYGYVDNVQKTVSGDLGTYGTSENLLLETINDTTFVVNPDVEVELYSITDESTELFVTHLNVINALNYNTTLTISDNLSGGGAITLASITIGDGANAEIDDAARATSAVAAELAAQIDSAIGYNAYAKNGSVAIERIPFVTSEYPTLDVTSGRADDVVYVPNIVSTIEGLPKYGIPDARITVKPDPDSDAGTYYLKAVAVDSTNTETMQEIVWTETRAIDEPYNLNDTTLPRTIVFNRSTETFTVGTPTGGWKDRETGDNESNPVPVFVGQKINALGQFQKRLVLVSENNVSMSRTDDLFNWWKKSALRLLATDPVEIASNSPSTDQIKHIVEHNRDLLFVASNGQFKIDGATAVTPQTVALPLTTSQEIQESVAPVPLGTAVYLPINYGTSTGITKYDGIRDEQDSTQPITHHVIGYMPGVAEVLVGSPNLDMLAMTTTESADNVIYVYEQFTEGGETSQRSWSTWTLPEDNVVLAMNFRRDQLSVVVQVGTQIIQKAINMYSKVATTEYDVFLDDFLALPTDGTTATLPEGYSTPDLIVVMGEGTIYPLERINCTVSGNTITFAEDIGAGEVYVGTPFRSAYQPTRPFVLDSNGIAVTTDKLRISRYILNVVDTEDVTMSIDSEYFEVADQTVGPRVIGQLSSQIGTVKLHTGDYKFSYAQEADLATATFFTEGWLGMTIAGISWLGQYKKSSRRLL